MKRYKQLAAVLVLALTLYLGVLYIRNNPSVIDGLRATSPVTILLLMILYAISIIGLLIVLKGNLKIADGDIPTRQGFLLTIYSTLINFFGPLQSGPGFRAIYLKKYHQISLKKYGLASIVYYILYGLISLILLLIGSSFWWLALPSSILLLGLVAGAARYQFRTSFFKPALVQAAALTLLGTVLQLTAICLVYFVELRSLDSSISLRQAMSYAGAANFALFVALTPGAIGFRESFLLFSQRLHHIDAQTIVAANVLDRSVYLMFLGTLGVTAIMLKANTRLHVRTLSNNSKL